MKTIKYVWLVLLFVGLVTGSVNAQDDYCANKSDGGVAGGPESSDDPCPTDDEQIEFEGVNPIRMYTRNVQRVVPDLEVWGGVGEH